VVWSAATQRSGVAAVLRGSVELPRVGDGCGFRRVRIGHRPSAAPIGTDIVPIFMKIDPIEMDIVPIFVDVDPIEMDVAPIFVDVDPIEMDVVSIFVDVDPIEMDVVPIFVDVDPFDMDVVLTVMGFGG
jgi:hypothetical protein